MRIGEALVEGVLMDISRGGALLQVDSPLIAVGTAGVLMVLNAGESVLLSAPCEIVRTQNNLLGLRFTAIDAAVEAGLRQIAELNLAPARLLQRDFSTLNK